MRIRLTIFLLIANLIALFAIWSLEREPEQNIESTRALIDITRLEVEGKGIEKARILVLENNKWKIISPIEWPANFFAVNRILNNLKFLEKESSFPASEIIKHGQTLTDYGLDDPAFTFKYGDENTFYTIKIGKLAHVGDKVYMLDSHTDKIIVADKELAESLSVDIDRLRSQTIFDIVRYEISSVAIRLPQGDAKAQAKTSWKRIGLIRDSENRWRIESPIVARASDRAVDAFLSLLNSMVIKSFVNVSEAEAGLDSSSWPASITIEGANKKQTLFIGKEISDSNQVYARFEDNPTIFTLDAEPFRDLSELQSKLRDRDIFKLDESSTVALDISKAEDVIKIRKLTSGTWDLSGKTGDKVVESLSADLSIVNELLTALKSTTARAFISDTHAEDLSEFGINKNSLRITTTSADDLQNTITIGAPYKQGAATLFYAKVDSDSTVYGISGELNKLFTTNLNNYKSRMLFVLPEKAVVTGIDIVSLADSKTLFTVANSEGNFSEFAASLGKREKQFFDTLQSMSKKFFVKNFLDVSANQEGFVLNSKQIDWRFKLIVRLSLPGTGGNEVSKREIRFSERLSGSLQYAKYEDIVFEFTQEFVDALFGLNIKTQSIQSQNIPEPIGPSEK